MKKILSILLALSSGICYAQTFPVNNLSVNGTSTFTGQSTFTVSPLMPTPTGGDSSTKGATTAFVGAALLPFAPLASPAFTGSPTAPTQAFGDASTDIATDQFVANSGFHFTTAGGLGINTNTSLNASQLNNWAQIFAANVTVTLPAISTTKAGQTISFISNGFSYTLAGAGADTINNFAGGISASSITSAPSENITLTSNGPSSGTWYAVVDGVSPKVAQISFGTSLKPLTTPGQISTTATSTLNSNSITVTSNAGLVGGMGIYASFLPSSCSNASSAFINPTILSIAGTTITMSCNAIATNASPVPVNFGQNRWNTTSLETANDLGVQTLKVGNAAGNGPVLGIQGNTASWLDLVSAGFDYATTAAAQILSVPGGGYGLVVGARASDSTGGAAPFPIASFLNLDTWGNTGYSAENVYLQDNLAAATAGHAQPHIQMEQSINSNWGTPPAEDPYTINVVNQTIAHRYDCGTGQSSNFPNNCTSAMDIVNNGAKFENGLVISSNALDTSGGAANAMSLPLNNQVIWYSASGTFSAAINSTSAGILGITVPGSSGQIQFTANGNNEFSITPTLTFTKPYTFASATTVACSAGTEGFEASITDGNTAAFNATVAGGGTNHVKIRCNGTNWVVY